MIPARGLDRPVELSFLAETPPGAVRRVTGATVLAVVPADAPSYAARLPGSVLRASSPSAECRVEHFALSRNSPIDRLPSLRDSAYPSLVADTVGTMLRAGAPSVDVLLLRANGAAPGEFTHPLILEQLVAWMPTLWGGLLTFPDLRRMSPAQTVRLGRALAPSAAELFLVLCLDLPDRTDRSALADALLGADALIATWSGTPQAVAAQAWRSAAGVVAGLLAADLVDPGRSLTHRPIPLLPPRRAVVDRRPLLTPRLRVPSVEALDERIVRLEIDGVANTALVRSELSLRRPSGAWPVPALFLAKYVRRAILEAADRFVFRPVHEQEAVALGGAIGIAMRPFVQRGLLVGAGGTGSPQIEAAVVRDPNAPGLAATLSGYLQPWMKRISLRVHVRAGDKPAMLEV